jgi:hypothetical protein
MEREIKTMQKLAKSGYYKTNYKEYQKEFH